MTSKIIALKILSFLVPIVFFSQNDSPFKYDPPPEELYSDPMNLSHAGGGIFFISDENNEFLSESLEVFPASFEFYYEYSRLLIPQSDKINVAANIGGQVIFPFLLGIRIPASVDLRLGSAARRDSPIGSRGLILGAGYEHVELRLGYSKSSSFARVGIGIEDVLAIYNYNFDNALLRHNVTVGVKLDW